LVPLPILRTIEAKYENDISQMDSAFANFDQCSAKCINLNIYKWYFIHFAYILCYNSTALKDKCATAAEIFQCGLAKDSSLINELIVDFKTPDNGVPVGHNMINERKLLRVIP
jgi:hypothetical protein